MANIMTVLNMLEEIEISMKNLYQWVSEEFSDDLDLYRFFQRMSREEETHAGMVRYQKRLIHQNPDSFDEVSIDLSELREFLDFISSIRKNSPDLTPESALKLAIQLEGMDEERMYRHAIVESYPELKELIHSLTQSDEQHCVFLKDFAKRYLTSEARNSGE
jgi:rubrerythrin